MQFSLGRKILMGFIVSALILIGVGIFSFKNSEKFVASNGLISHTHEVIYELQQVLVATINAETGTRGFVITGDAHFLEPFNNATTIGFEHLGKLKTLTIDNPAQQKNIEELEREFKVEMAYCNKCINLRKTEFENARDLVATGEGKLNSDEIREIINRAQDAELTLLAIRKQTSIQDINTFNLFLGALFIIMLIILAYVYGIVTKNLKALTIAEDETSLKNWLLAGNTELSQKLIGVQHIEELANNSILFLCSYLKASIGAVYVYYAKEDALLLKGQYAFASPEDTKTKFMFNEGVIGQAAREQKPIFIKDVTDEQIHITSSLLHAKPKQILVVPFLFEGKTLGVVEIGSLTEFTKTETEFIHAAMNIIGISVNSAIDRKRILELLEKAQIQSKEKENRAAELVIANQELAYQNEEKEKRADELAIANKELAYQNEEKENRATELVIANKELAFQSDEKENRAAELVIANKELAFQNEEKENRATELVIANKELVLQNEEKGNRAAELVIANKELAFQSQEKENRAAELAIANKELAFQSDEKEKRAAELVIANQELAYQNEEKGKRAEELLTANHDLALQSEELQTQQEELKQMNEELEEQAQNLIQQQEELQMSNEELEEQTQSLEMKNIEVEAAKENIEQKTKQLEVSSKYKSEFLANMSHELRTPLNSLLILSKDLSENRKKNLDAIQVESAEIIYKSGTDLLTLINEVLDLSKIESGKMSIQIENVSLRNFADELIRMFKHQAELKGLMLTCAFGNELPEFIRTDLQRLNQILKNLLSNAIKFTDIGSVGLRIDRYGKTMIIISITDTGLGIMEDKQMAIFEAFQQADGGTSRKYGGTGLGLSISRELAKLLGAEIKVSSQINKGSTFSVILPIEIYDDLSLSSNILAEPVAQTSSLVNSAKYLNYQSIPDDRDNIVPSDIIVLIIEDDLKFASILSKQASKKGFKCLVAASGEDGLVLTEKYHPQAIILDMGLPGMSGHQVLHELKASPSVRHIPVHIISANDHSLELISDGALEYIIKPISKIELEETFNRIENFVNRKIKNLLIIEDNENSRKAMSILIGNGDVKCFEASTAKAALSIYQKTHIDCIILDIGLPDMSGFDLIRQLKTMKDHAIPPIIVYTGKELTKEEDLELQKYSESIIIKGVRSEERLLDESALFLHRTISKLPKSKQLMINGLYDKETIFHSKKILLVDDDTRNVFALSKILMERGMEIIKAENGKVALKMLEIHPDINLVLMDIMMPEMDGYEAMKGIRSQIKLRRLPVIALTAKAMKDDKQKCIDAGANDYITKPIDVDRLLSLMRVWLSN